ncbi:MAG: 4-hydroxybenzoate octaprenyltransferase [Geminicoccaceae bacterium]
MSGQGSGLQAPVADRQGAWTDRLPPRWRDFAVLARWDRPIGTWLLLLPCWWGLALADGLPNPWLLPLFAVGAVAMRGAGCTINDLADREFDRRVERTRNRPLAAGRVGAREALLFVCVQCLVGLLVLAALNWTAVLVALASAPLIVVYPFMKRITWWPQAFLGITFNWGVLVGSAQSTGSPGWPAVLLYAAGICWTLGYDTIYALQDKEDDALIGVRSTALLFGDAVPIWVAGFYLLTLTLLLAGGVAAGKGILFVLGLVPVAWLLLRQAVDLRTATSAECLRRFRANRDAGLAVFAVLILGSLV